MEHVVPSQPSEGTPVPASVLISDFWPEQLSDDTFLLFKPLSLWCFVSGVLEKRAQECGMREVKENV